MANILNFSIVQKCNCIGVTFKELSGAYTGENIGGWGTPNEETSEASVAALIITFPSGATVFVNLSPSYPTVDTTLEFEVTSVLAGTISCGITFEIAIVFSSIFVVCIFYYYTTYIIIRNKRLALTAAAPVAATIVNVALEVKV